MSDSLQPPGLQHTRLPCPSPTPRVCSSSCALYKSCHPTISSSVVPFSSHLIPHKGPCVLFSHWIYFLDVSWLEVCRSLISWRMVLLKCLIFPGILQLLFFNVFQWRPVFPKEIKLYVLKMDSLDTGISLGIQWLRFPPCSTGDLGSIPGQGTKILSVVQSSSPRHPINNKKRGLQQASLSSWAQIE